MAYSLTYRYRLVTSSTLAAPSAVRLDMEVTAVTSFADLGLFLVRVTPGFATDVFQRPCSPADLGLFPFNTADTNGFKRVAAIALTFPGVYISESSGDWCTSTVTSPLNSCADIVQRTTGADNARQSLVTALTALAYEMHGLAAAASYSTQTITAP